MPRAWHDRHTVNKITDEKTRALYRRIVADKKPYFMRYIYPALMKEYNTYIKKTNRSALNEFGLTVDELQSMDDSELDERKQDFLSYYDYRMPVGLGDCVMNKICRRFENEFDGHIGKHNASANFDYSIMKSGREYNKEMFYDIKHLYDSYNKRLKSYKAYANYDRVNPDEYTTQLHNMDVEFQRECSEVCPNSETLCDVILDICYTRSSTRKFAWSVCNSEIIMNLLRANDWEISYPMLDNDGAVSYGGNTYNIKTKRIEVTE